MQIAAGTSVSQETTLELGEWSPFTCPECHGALINIKEDKLSRFRCHTGHGFTEDALLEAVMQSTGEAIWQVTRGLQETVMLLQHMGNHIRDAGVNARAEEFFTKARDLERRASRFQELAQEHESMSGNKLETAEEEQD